MNQTKNTSQTSPQKISLILDSDAESFSTDSSLSRSPRSVPIPKDHKKYAQAKRAEYRYKDLEKAETLYKQAIKKNDRKLSAIKDLASLMNQTGRTREAIAFLKTNEKLFKNDQSHYLNLVSTLENHLKRQDKSLKKSIKISFLSTNVTKEDVFKLFACSSRIQEIFLNSEICQGRVNQFCIIHFNSQSSARKTLEGFKFWDDYIVQWVDVTGKVLCDAHYAKQKIENHRLNTPTFNHVIFDKDPAGQVFCLAIDDCFLSNTSLNNTKQEERLIGSGLLKLIMW